LLKIAVGLEMDIKIRLVNPLNFFKWISCSHILFPKICSTETGHQRDFTIDSEFLLPS